MYASVLLSYNTYIVMQFNMLQLHSAISVIKSQQVLGEYDNITCISGDVTFNQSDALKSL